MRFVMLVENQDDTFADICRRFGVSRKTGYKWLARYRAYGSVGLNNRSRAPHTHPQAISPESASHVGTGESAPVA
jgi:transposase-like protein